MVKTPTSQRPPAVLVVGPAWVGDMVMAQSLFMTLRARQPAPAVDVIAPAWSLPLLERMPEVRRAIPLPVGHGELGLGKRWRLGRSLRSASYDQAIVLPRSAKAALPVFAARIPRRTGYRGESRYGLLNDIRPLDRAILYRTVDRFVALGHTADTALPPPISHPALAVSDAGRQEARRSTGLDMDDAPVLALCPGAEYGPSKRWPASSYAEVAREYLADGWQVWLFGSDKDTPVTRTIAEAAPGCRDLAGRTQLGQAIDLLACADLVISNDSGLMHIAAATGRPVVAIYGSSDPNYTPPLSERARILHLGLDCSPCFQRECPLGHLNCLRQLAPAQVLDAAGELTKRDA
ncbi:lipopolysaccharide heptosyltransferase II [Thioalkalivibrio sp. AKL6]|uniref:lipopolysaccharide heptosyltransferase II n=1 Tax=Thioalkalivibrio sp. AKL6 TaxID=1158154 RepID=UPI00035CA67A|nr:lipopolysaccharide heptosyltransferase II [Thioalkalivibrio sp. AKL6]